MQKLIDIEMNAHNPFLGKTNYKGKFFQEFPTKTLYYLNLKII